ncbi:uncharacterized protein F5147DRAFT_772967 [Suillus discolor]|uniref:DUF6533 domain-containing protein n=1 Tax=Suillus discolor TaxID=1912936 RepID=A0A9P7F8A0_9AGAM|nr:uncharacterized protein F5147DRAFT_772967 [Suillus discolor]KAG2109682.1 hypothetical protein F5147DRAFT_772967 [Suillus discolor]
MTVVSNDPSWWPFISSYLFLSYWMVAAGLVVVYDWVLTLGEEIELIWTQRWSLMTVLYLVIRYVGISYFVVNALVIMIARLHAMYQGSGKMLILLVIVFLAVNIACGVIAIIGLKYHSVSEKLILSGIHMCGGGYDRDTRLLMSMVWMLNTVWEVFTLCLSVWIAAKHFHDLRRLGPLTGSIIGDCFRVLMESHVLYFASFAGVSCLQLVILSPELENSNSIGVEILGAMDILLSVQMFVLGPRLILSVRQYHAKLVAESDTETSMNSIVFQERIHVLTSSTV